MAAAEVIRWSTVVGEYGVFLTEMGSMEDLQTPIKPYPRIKYTCMTASKKYIAMGSSTGAIYIFDRKTLKHIRFISNKDGPILAVCFTQSRSLLGVATSSGIVLVLQVSSKHREKPKFIRRSEEHKNTTVTALCWDKDECRLFAGDVNGVVSVIHVPVMPHSVNKGFPLLHTSGIVAKAQTVIVQLDYINDKLLVSTMTKTAIVDLKSLDCVPVGVKLRDGLYGSCFFKEENSDSPTVYSARPGSRLWEASMDGQVMATQQYKKLLGSPPAPILGFSHGDDEPIDEEEFPPQSVNFAKLLLVRSRFLITWHGSSLYIMDPILGQLVAWYNINTVVQDLVCIGREFYVYDAEDCVKWFALLSVKECISRLHEMGEIRQCLKVVLDCKHFIIPGSARDVVPVSLVTNLKESLSEEDMENKDQIAELEELERDMEPATDENVNLPDFHGNTSLTDSPDTLSVCSDALTDDLEPNGRMAEIGQEDDSSPNNKCDDDGSEVKGALHRKLMKQWSGNISLEGMLISAAAAAKKFTSERQKGNLKMRRFHSADSAGGERREDSPGANSSSESQSDAVEFKSETASDPGAGQPNELPDIQEVVREEESPRLQKKSLEQSPCHSDDSESRQSGNEGAAVEEEIFEKRERREKKKKKKRVVTVDIDSPQLKQEVSLGSPIPHVRSASFRGTYSPTEDAEVRSRLSSEPEKLVTSPAQSELPPAIPAMLSKAKGLLKKKLKVPSEDSSSLPSPTPPMEEETICKREEEVDSEEMECPPEVEELIRSSTKTRNEVKNPVVLFSISSLRKVLEEWVPKLHAAMKSCHEFNKNIDENNTKVDLKLFLDEPAFGDVAHLTRMCFDCGVFGVECMVCLEDLSHEVLCSEEKIMPNGSLAVQDGAEIIDEKKLKNGGIRPLLHNSLETVSERMTNGFNGVYDVGQSAQAGKTTVSDLKSISSNSTDVQEVSVKVEISNSDTKEAFQILPMDKHISGEDKLILSTNKRCKEALPNSTMNGDFSNGEGTHGPSFTQKERGIFSSAKDRVLVCLQCKEGTAFSRIPHENAESQRSEQRENDTIRSKFLSYYFFLLDVKQLRRTLFMSKGDRRTTWRAFIDGMSGLVTTDDVIVKYLKDGDPRRALHELHDGMEAYSSILLYHLTRLYEYDRRETMITCARMFPDVQPWEVMEICRQNSGLSFEARSDDFVFYVEQLMRWRAEVGITKEKTVSKICEDVGVALWWFHCSLVVDSVRDGIHCQHCGNPRPGSHMVPWQKADHLQQLIDFLLHKDAKECNDFMDLCWKHGYWVGLIRLCVRKNLRQDALKLVFSLGDLNLIRETQPWGRLPKSLDEWKYLLELLLSRDGNSDKSHACPHSYMPLSLTDWTPNLTWSNVINLMLERLGAGHTVNLLQALPRDTPLLTTDFYYSCLLGAVIERRQRTLIHELLKKLDSYLWSQRSGSLAPKLNSFRKEEETYGPKSKEDVNPQLESMEQFRTLEDGASNWGQNIRLSDGECLVCSLKLCEQISTSNQGLLLFECGHIFHKHCVPEAACILCFQQNLTTIG